LATNYDPKRLLAHVVAALAQEGVKATPANPKWERVALDLAAPLLDALGVEPHPLPAPVKTSPANMPRTRTCLPVRPQTRASQSSHGIR
jgi:hypothetical protein